jgi:hypothetical protein
MDKDHCGRFGQETYLFHAKNRRVPPARSPGTTVTECAVTASLNSQRSLLSRGDVNWNCRTRRCTPTSLPLWTRFLRQLPMFCWRTTPSFYSSRPTALNSHKTKFKEAFDLFWKEIRSHAVAGRYVTAPRHGMRNNMVSRTALITRIEIWITRQAMCV